MGIQKIRKFIRRFPGYVLAVLAVQFLLSAVFLSVIYYHACALQRTRLSAEARAEAEFASEVHIMELTAEDNTLTDGQKRLILYGKSQSAVGALASTSYGDDLKRTVTEALNGISRHMLEENDREDLLLSHEVDFLHLFGEESAEEAYEEYLDSMGGELLSVETEKAGESRPQNLELFKGKREIYESANRLFGVTGILTEENWERKGALLFSCKNAYAVMHQGGCFPLEAEIYLPAGEEKYTAEECLSLAKGFLEEVYPKKIYRALSEASERDGDGFFEIVFGGGEGHFVTVRISKSSGRMIRLHTEGLEHVVF